MKRLAVLAELIEEVRRRVRAGAGVLAADAVRVFWVNPVADLRVMNLLEDAGGRVCGSDYLFCHALDPIPTDLPPLEALAGWRWPTRWSVRPRTGPGGSCADIGRFGAEAVVISRIPGASHCALEGAVIADVVRAQIGVPVVEIEVPPVTDAMEPTLRTRLEALVETVRDAARKSPFAWERDRSKTANGTVLQDSGRRRTDEHESATMICAGIDAGSRTTKVVLLDAASRKVVAAGVVDQGIEQDALADSLLERLLQEKGIGRAGTRPGRGHRLRPQTDPPGRRAPLPRLPARRGAFVKRCPRRGPLSTSADKTANSCGSMATARSMTS